MRFAAWTLKATNTHSEYAILVAFPLLQWLHERVSALRYSTLPALVLLVRLSHDTDVLTVFAGLG